MTWDEPGGESDSEDKEMNEEIECRDDEFCVCDECWSELLEPDDSLILTLLEQLGL